jgi:hypothetical protein
MRPMDFAAQLNVSLANGWGIVRTVADLCLKMPEGKYVLVKDPNKVSALWSVSRCWRISRAVPCEFPGLPDVYSWFSTRSLTVTFFTAGDPPVCRAFLGIHRRRRGGRRRGFRGRSGALRPKAVVMFTASSCWTATTINVFMRR